MKRVFLFILCAVMLLLGAACSEPNNHFDPDADKPLAPSTTTTEKVTTTATTSDKGPPPDSGKLICTIIDDDAMSLSNVNKFKYVCDQSGIKAAVATLTERWDETEPLAYDNAAGLKSFLHQMQDEGFDILFHAYHQGGSNVYGEDCWRDINNISDFPDRYDETERQCREDMEKGLQMMRAEGFNTDFWVTPESCNHSLIVKLAKEYGFKARFTGGEIFNSNKARHTYISTLGKTVRQDTSRYFIYRQTLNHLSSFEGDLEKAKTSFYAQVKEVAEQCTKEGQGWLVLMTHFQKWGNGKNSYQVSDNALACFQDTVQKLKDLGYEFMTVSEAWEYVEPIYRFYDPSETTTDASQTTTTIP